MLLAPEANVEPEPGRDRAQSDRRCDVRSELSRGALLRTVLLREALRPLLSVILLHVLVVAVAVLAGELDRHAVRPAGHDATRRSHVRLGSALQRCPRRRLGRGLGGSGEPTYRGRTVDCTRRYWPAEGLLSHMT